MNAAMRARAARGGPLAGRGGPDPGRVARRLAGVVLLLELRDALANITEASAAAQSFVQYSSASDGWRFVNACPSPTSLVALPP